MNRNSFSRRQFLGASVVGSGLSQAAEARGPQTQAFGVGGDSLLAEAVFDIRQFGAVGDGAHLDTAAIQRAIDACAASGGGTVRVPTGRYLTGTIFLKSHVTLHLAPAATILGSTRLEDYDSSVERCGFTLHPYIDLCLIYA